MYTYTKTTMRIIIYKIYFIGYFQMILLILDFLRPCTRPVLGSYVILNKVQPNHEFAMNK